MQRSQWHPTPVLLPGKSHGWRSLEGCSPWDHWQSDTTQRLHFHFSLSSLEKEMATHSSILAWRIPGTGEPGELPSLGSQRVGHNWSDLAAAAAAYIWINKITQFVFCSSHLSLYFILIRTMKMNSTILISPLECAPCTTLSTCSLPRS